MVEEQAAEVLRRRTVVSVREAKDQLSTLLQRAAAGEEVVITSDGEPRAMLVRHKPVVGGKPWTSIESFRARQPMTPDSTPEIRAQRDQGS
jgi:prevent-host-death family protein